MSDSAYDVIMGLDLDDSRVDEPISRAGTPMSDLIYTEEVSPQVASVMIGEDNVKPNCVFKMTTDRYSTVIARFDKSLKEDDPEYCAEFTLETYNPENRIDRDSVRDGILDAENRERKPIDARKVIFILFTLLLAVGLGLIWYVLYWL